MLTFQLHTVPPLTPHIHTQVTTSHLCAMKWSNLQQARPSCLAWRSSHHDTLEAGSTSPHSKTLNYSDPAPLQTDSTTFTLTIHALLHHDEFRHRTTQRSSLRTRGIGCTRLLRGLVVEGRRAPGGESCGCCRRKLRMSHAHHRAEVGARLPLVKRLALVSEGRSVRGYGSAGGRTSGLVDRHSLQLCGSRGPAVPAVLQRNCQLGRRRRGQALEVLRRLLRGGRKLALRARDLVVVLVQSAVGQSQLAHHLHCAALELVGALSLHWRRWRVVERRVQLHLVSV